MIITKLKVTNFKSIYNTQEFNFDELGGLIKLTGPIGAGKTTLCEAILYGLYGAVRNQKISSLVSWNTKAMSVEIELRSKGHNLHIVRNSASPMEFFVDGNAVPAPSKRDFQEIIDDYYDTPRIVVEKMCLISFESFKTSLANMSPSETKNFVDDVFGFKLFTDYSDISNRKKLDIGNEVNKLQTELNLQRRNVENILQKREEQKRIVNTDIDIVAINNNITLLEEQKKQYNNTIFVYNNKLNEIVSETKETKNGLVTLYNNTLKKRTEIEVTGKQYRKQYEQLKSGICPTCGHKIEEGELDEIKNKIDDCGKYWKIANVELKQIATRQDELNEKIEQEQRIVRNDIAKVQEEIHKINLKISEYNNTIKSYNDKIKLLESNYDNIINSYNDTIDSIESKLGEKNKELDNFSELTTLLSKTLRYKLIDNIIPSINGTIQSYIDAIGLQFSVSYDSEFKAHIYSNSYDKEIPYSSLSTGQKKSVDMSIIFGILHFVINSVDFNIMIMDELFSNMDNDTRNVMLELLSGSISENRSIFVVNHADMPDDYFNHKLNVKLQSSNITLSKRSKEYKVPVCRSEYTLVF